jgi:UDP-N-acetylmuramoyl-tripeptide--D-alanyl-D-alanine ligase
MRTPLGQCAEWCGGDLFGDRNLEITGICADSRLCGPGDLFVGIAGPNFDGNEYVADAVKHGAVAALVREEGHLNGLPGIVAIDTIAALGSLAYSYRMNRDIPWIGITGSNGKTTTRELLTCILETRGTVASSMRNYNNNIGVPLSILAAPDDAWAGVIEIGTNFPGEVAALAAVLRPEIGILTSVGRAHLEGIGTPQDIAREKASLMEALPDDGLAIYPLNAPHREEIEARVHSNRRTFAVEGDADIRAEGIEPTETGARFSAWTIDFDLPLPGQHNVSNALAAIAAADWLGVTPAEAADALQRVEAVPGRLQVKQFGPVRVIDDTYNSNPESLTAAVEVLCGMEARRRVAIIGPMAELGDQSDALHRQAGIFIGQQAVDVLIVCTPRAVGLAEAAATASASCKVHYFPSVSALLPRLKELLQGDDLILLKASRIARMEKAVGRIESIFAGRRRESPKGAEHA